MNSPKPVNNTELNRAEQLWNESNPHPEGTYAWYGWSMEFMSDDGHLPGLHSDNQARSKAQDPSSCPITKVILYDT